MHINADDFGRSHAINNGIKQAILSGKINSVSVMVNAPYFQDAVNFLRQHPEIKVGLHFTLSKFATDNSLIQIISQLIIRQNSKDVISRELKKQYQRLKATGLPIHHLDSHQHIHLHPPIFRLFLNFAKKHHIPYMRANPFSLAQFAWILRHGFTFKQMLIWIVYGINHLIFIGKKSSQPSTALFLYDLNWKKLHSTSSFKNILSSLPNQSEVICHLSQNATNKSLKQSYYCLNAMLQKHAPLIKRAVTIKWLILILLVWKIVDLVTSLIAPYAIPYLGFFSYAPTMLQYNMPAYIRSLTNFDGIFYIRIASNGYSLTEQAYFPLYPVLISLVSFVTRNHIVSAILISHSAFIIGILWFKNYLQLIANQKTVYWSLLFLIAYPVSYYFGVVYTESLFFCLLVGTLYFVKKRNYYLSTLCAFLVALTRVVGILIILPIVTEYISKVWQHRHKYQSRLSKSLLSQWQILLPGFSAIAGLLSYSYYLWQSTGNPLYFIKAQESFGAHRSSSLISPPHVLFRYAKIIFTANLNFQYFIAVLELCFYLITGLLIIFELYAIAREYRQKKLLPSDRLGLALFSGANILIPSLTGTLTAMPRYTLMSLTIFLMLSRITSEKLKYSLLLGSSLLHVVFFALYIQGYYVT